MNTRELIIAAVAATALIGAAGSALAQEATPDTWLNVASSQSRADVQAQLQSARQTGALAVYKSGYIPQVAQSASRDAVRADTRQAIADGAVAALNAQAFDFGAAHATQVAGSPAVKAAR